MSNFADKLHAICEDDLEAQRLEITQRILAQGNLRAAARQHMVTSPPPSRRSTSYLVKRWLDEVASPTNALDAEAQGNDTLHHDMRVAIEPPPLALPPVAAPRPTKLPPLLAVPHVGPREKLTVEKRRAPPALPPMPAVPQVFAGGSSPLKGPPPLPSLLNSPSPPSDAPPNVVLSFT